MLKNFRTYSIAVGFYHLAKTLSLSAHFKDQLERASSSVVLNLAEGYGRQKKADQNRFFHIALGSMRECQAILQLNGNTPYAIADCTDKLGAHLYRLIMAMKKAA